MNLFRQKIERVKNNPKFTIPRDFHFNPFSYLLLGLFLVAGVLLQHQFTGMPLATLIAIAGSLLGQAVILTILPIWSVMLVLQIVFWLILAAGMPTELYPDLEPLNSIPWILGGIGSLGVFCACSTQLIAHWDKVVILRFGKFRKVHGPGLFALLPLVDRIAAFVDTRIRATDFSAEKTLTKDTVPVHVDALAFWMIWDAQKAVLEVENYVEAVILSAQTALRDSIGKYDLATILSEREALGKEIQAILDAKTNPWGITILSVEFTDIIIPQELEDAMSKQAQAERERQSRVILGTAEEEIADKFVAAAEKYKASPTAMQLRAMNMVYEGIRQKGSLMILPSSALDGMNLGTVMGAAAMNKTIMDVSPQGETPKNLSDAKVLKEENDG